MSEKINDFIGEAIDSLVASAKKSSADIIVYKRCSATFKEINRPVYSVTDLKGLKFFSSFILESIHEIVQNKIKQGKTYSVKRKQTEQDIETEKRSEKKRKKFDEKKYPKDSGLKCQNCEQLFSRRDNVKRHMDKGSCKVLKKNVKKPKESAVTTEHLPNKRVTEGSPAFAVLQALFLNTNDEKKSMSKEDIREKAQQFTRSNLTLNNKEDLDEWKTTWSGIDALSGRMALIEKVGQPVMYTITKKGRAMMECWFIARQRERGEKEGRREEEEEEERGRLGRGRGEENEEPRRKKTEEGVMRGSKALVNHESGCGLMANPGSSCYAGCAVQGIISAGLDQALDHGAKMDPQYTNLKEVLQRVCQLRRDPSRPAVDPIPLIKSLNAVTLETFDENSSESASDFLRSILDSVVLVPQSLTSFQEVGSCNHCGRNYCQVPRLSQHWITVPLYHKDDKIETVARAKAMLHSLPSGLGTLCCDRDPDTRRPCLRRPIPSRLEQLTGRYHDTKCFIMKYGSK